MNEFKNDWQGVFPYENYSYRFAPTDPKPLGSWNDIMGSLAEQRYFGVVEVNPPLSIRVSQVDLCWPTATNLVYQLQYRSSLTSNTWINLGSQVVGTGSTMCATDGIVAGTPQRFYQVTTVP